jgi:DNA-binding PadR family transcriptional regulator
MTGETLKGHLDALVLASLRDGPLHGYAIIAELKRRSGGAFDLPEGTVYPVLHRLEVEGLLASAWSSPAGRRRRVYRLTRRGRSALARRRQDWRDFARAVEAVLA